MKFLFVLLQVYLLFINTVFSQSEYRDQRDIEEIFYSINLEKLTLISKELSKMQKDPSTYLAGFKDKKIKDYKNFVQEVKLHEQAIKEVKVAMKNDTLQISTQKHLTTISEIGISSNEMIINGQKITWNPETDTLNDLHQQLSVILKLKGKISFINYLIPEADAFGTGIVEVGLLVSGFAFFIIAFMGIGITITDRMKHKFSVKITHLITALKKCERDTKDTIGPGGLPNLKIENDTLKFINMLKMRTPEKPFILGKCKAILDDDSQPAKATNDVKDEKWYLKTLCDKIDKLQACLEKYDKDVRSRNISDTNRNSEKLSPNNASYGGVIKTLDEVAPK